MHKGRKEITTPKKHKNKTLPGQNKNKYQQDLLQKIKNIQAKNKSARWRTHYPLINSH
jgi:hypothetical protein